MKRLNQHILRYSLPRGKSAVAARPLVSKVRGCSPRLLQLEYSGLHGIPGEVGDLAVSSIRIRTVVETDGELHVRNLPCRKGDEVEAIVMLPDHPTDEQCMAAKQRFLDRARSSQLKSPGKYPSREELHERS